MEETSRYLISKVRELEEKVRNLEEKFSDEAWRAYAIRKASEDWSEVNELFEF